MESEFQKIKKDKIKIQKNIALLAVIIYIIAVFILFGLGGKLADLATSHISLISVAGIIKMAAIIFSVILVAIVFIPGPIIVLSEINEYFGLKD